ncbi:i-spanin [Achromobacter phage Mano]|uniref:I-spanin n=1 Tax=Achromobacter phage Mano TaxID=2767570 RepID=A0A7L8G6E9_9CAUD|nr:i-spanin [Achromobacter phage Mano]QOE32796.1 i-spanin [Achromobacter phage Mano]
MNRAIIAALVAVCAVIGAYAYGVSMGKDREAATQARIDKAMQDTREAAQQGAAQAIAQIKITNTTIRGEVQREIQTNTVYRDCRIPADGVRLINEAITGQRPVTPGGGQLPRTGTDTGKQ